VLRKNPSGGGETLTGTSNGKAYTLKQGSNGRFTSTLPSTAPATTTPATTTKK
jgi:hypothetical protein